MEAMDTATYATRTRDELSNAYRLISRLGWRVFWLEVGQQKTIKYRVGHH